MLKFTIRTYLIAYKATIIHHSCLCLHGCTTQMYIFKTKLFQGRYPPQK